MLSADGALVEACRQVLSARQAVQNATRARDVALVAWKQVHPEVPAVRAGDAVQQQLRQVFSDEELALIGLSNGSVRAALYRPRA